MSSLLEQNLKFLSRYNAELANQINDCSNLTANYEINQAKSGDSILYKNNFPVDDDTDPVWNATEIYSRLNNKGTKSITVLLGMGLGYNFKEFAKRYKGKLILHEPNLEFLRIAFEFVDFTEELSKKNIIITNKIDDIYKAFNTLFYRGYKYNFIASDYYTNYENQDLEEIENSINKCYATYEQSHNNLWRKNQGWTILLFNNMIDVFKSHDMHILKDKFQNKTAVIISAGPSLDKNIENLKPYRDNLVVFCVGVAFKTAVSHGIIPDFVSVIDNSKEILDLPEISQTNVIASTYACDGVFQLNAKRIYNYHSKNTPACKWLAKVLAVPDINYYESAGTVAINCVHSAKLMGCKKIILIGQDLAYTDNRCYSKNSLYGGYNIDKSKKSQYDESVGKNIEVKPYLLEFLGKDLVPVKGLNGETLYTRPDYYMFKMFFEELAKKLSPELELINATEGGAYIDGFKHITLNEALKEVSVDEKIDVEQILNDSELNLHEKSKRKKRLLEELSLISKNYNELRKLIISNYKQGFEPYFTCDTLKKYDNSYLKDKINLSFQVATSSLNLSQEEIDSYEKFVDERRNVQSEIKNQIKDMFENKPDLFAENLKTIKDKYRSLRKLIDINPYHKCFYLTLLMYIDRQIEDFDNTDEELMDLSYAINELFFIMHYYSMPFSEMIEDCISKLEKY